MMQYNRTDGSTAPIVGLFIMAFFVVGLGSAFAVYSVINNVSLSIMGSKFPAVILAAVVVFLGVRYVISTVKLSKKIKGQHFSWNNFKKTAKERRG